MMTFMKLTRSARYVIVKVSLSKSMHKWESFELQELYGYIFTTENSSEIQLVAYDSLPPAVLGKTDVKWP